MLAVVDYPSPGLGWEMAIASGLAIPTLIVAQSGRPVNRLVEGIAEVIPLFKLERYKNLQNVTDQLDHFLRTIRSSGS